MQQGNSEVLIIQFPADVMPDYLFSFPFNEFYNSSASFKNFSHLMKVFSFPDSLKREKTAVWTSVCIGEK